jgi:hypothetical protein
MKTKRLTTAGKADHLVPIGEDVIAVAVEVEADTVLDAVVIAEVEAAAVIDIVAAAVMTGIAITIRRPGASRMSSPSMKGNFGMDSSGWTFPSHFLELKPMALNPLLLE